MTAHTFWRQVLDAFTHSGPGYDPTPLPVRGDAVAKWLKQQRDVHLDDYRSPPPEWHTLDRLLDLYRLHADTRTPLGEHVCEGQTVGDCECLEDPHPF